VNERSKDNYMRDLLRDSLYQMNKLHLLFSFLINPENDAQIGLMLKLIGVMLE